MSAKATRSISTTHHSDWVVTPRGCQAELLDVCVLLHGFGEVLQRGNRNVLEKQTKTLPLVWGLTSIYIHARFYIP